ncbi:MAG: PQQ-binding-like beta-propeller repeat protein [Verrucomicrobium sp.]
MKASALPSLALVWCLSLLPAPANWPQFRGPNRDATSQETQVPAQWSNSQNLRWKLDLPGAGASSPVVWGDKVFVTSFSGQEESGDVSGLVRHITAVDRLTGSKLWQKDYPTPNAEDPWQGMIREHGYTSSTPVTDGKALYVHFGKGGLVALDLNGKELWKAPTGKNSNQRRWGSGGSPMLWQNLVIINASDEDQSLMAFDKTTGQRVWRQGSTLLDLAFSSPQLLKQKDGREDLVFAAPGELWGMNPGSGKLRWYALTGLDGNISPDPLVENDMVYVFGGFPGTGRIAVKAGVSGEVPSSAIAWRDNTSSYVPTPVLHDGRLYVVNDQGFAWCADAKTGTEIYRERVGGGSTGRGRGKPFYASPVIVGDKIYAVSRRQGTFVLAATPKFEVLATNLIPGDDTDFNATPAVSDGCLFLRSNQTLYCVGAGK